MILFPVLLRAETVQISSGVATAAHILHNKIDNLDNDQTQADQSFVPDAAWWDGDAGAVYGYLVVSTISYSAPAALEIRYNKELFNYPYFAAGDLKNGVNPNGYNNSDFSVSVSSSISLRIYAADKNIDFLVKFKDISDVESNDIGTEITVSFNSWQKLTFSWTAAELGGCDIKNVKHILIFAEPGDTDVTGKFYIDDVILEDAND